MIEELQAGRLTLRDIPPIRVVRHHIHPQPVES